MLALVLAFVGRTLRDGLRDLTEQRLVFSWRPALAACVIYSLAQLVMGAFWRRVLIAVGQPAPVGVALPAYLVSQLGKYVPGKASVVLIRTERVAAATRRRSGDVDHKTPLVTVGASVFYETLTFMAVGSLIAAGLIPLVDGAEKLRWLAPAALGLAAVCLAPATPPVFRWLLGRFTAASGRAALRDRLRERLGYGLAAHGVASAAVAWGLLAVFLWLVAESVGVAGGLGLADLPFWALAAALPTVAGFVSLLPAGIGVREAVSLALLAPALGEGGAVAVAAAARLFGVATEVVVCASLLVGGFGRHRRPPDPARDAN